MSTDSKDATPTTIDAALAASGVPVSATTIRRALAAGRVSGIRVGKRWLTTPDAIVAAMVRQVGPAVPAHLPMQVAP